MFSNSEKYYDALYEALGKDYRREAAKAHKLIQRHKRSEGNLLLDVACGTGTHSGYFSKYYEVAGLDLDPAMISIARKKYPKIRFHRGNMMDFDLGRQFDAIVCLFSSIGYVRTKANLQKTVRNLDRHLVSGGVLLIEPWFTPEQWDVERVNTLHVNQPDQKITRMSYGGRRGNVSTLDFHYLIGTKKGLEHKTEYHELGLFSHSEYMKAFHTVGLKVIHDKKGLDGRGLYIGIKKK